MFVGCISYLFTLLGFGNMLVQTMALCFALALLALLCWGSCLVERIREYISLSLPRTDVGGIIVQAHEAPAHSYMGCLKLLINNWVFVAAIYSLCRSSSQV